MQRISFLVTESAPPLVYRRHELNLAPNDPVFFLHLSNIDRLWAVWQRQHPRAAPYLPAVPTNGTFALHDQLIFTQSKTISPTSPFSDPWLDPPATPAQVVSHLALNYFFEDTEAY